MSTFEPQGTKESNRDFARRRIKFLVDTAFREGREILVGHRWSGGGVTYVYEGGDDMVHLLDDLRAIRAREVEKKYLQKSPTIKKARRAPKHQWRGSEEILCIRCLRAIVKGDKVHVETFYDENGPVEYVTHHDCSDTKQRPRLPLPSKATVVIGKKGTRRMVMSTKAETTNQNEGTMSDTTETKATAKKSSTKKASAKKGAKKTKASATKSEKSTKPKASKNGKKAPSKKSAVSEGTGSMAVTVGTRLQPLLKGNKNVGSIVKALIAGEDVSHKKLITLRDEIKDVAAKFREDGKANEASQLSSVNQLVRRLERAAR